MVKVNVEKAHTLTGHRDCVYALCGSSDPGRFFSGSGDGMVVAWDIAVSADGDLVARLPNSVYALHALAGQDLLVVGHNFDGIHVIDWRQKKESYSLQLTKASIFDIQSYGTRLYVATGDGELVVIDEPGRVVVARIQATSGSARSIAVSEKNGEYAVGYSDQHIRVFDLATNKMKKEWHAHANSVFTVQYSPDSRMLVSGSRDAHVKRWDAAGNYALVDDIAAHMYAVNHVVYSPDHKHFVTCSMDKSIKVWEADSGRLLKVIDKARHAGHGTSVNKLLWISFNNQLVSASDDRTISVWDLFFDH
jgi:WD40 repeat protein